MNRTPYAILDAEENVVAVLLGKPVEGEERDPEKRWDAAIERLAHKFEAARTKRGRKFAAGLKNHRRGKYTASSFGVSYGGGQKRPGNLAMSADHREMVEEFRTDEDLGRVAGWQSNGFASYGPKGYDSMVSALDRLYDSQPELQRNFPNSAYPCATANLGPNTVCLAHNDCSNFPSFPCAVTPFGSFDPDKGGQLILYDLKVKIRFPSGSTILLPSAGMRHGNVPIQAGERRYSFTQYCPGGLMRWVRHGLQPAWKLSPATRSRLDGEGGEGWQAQLRTLSKYSELAADRAWLVEREAARLSRG
ncbi:hypothetical protein FA95DRAFT_1502363 [Auriscalpium vulgare]|uniref:Uncharacterized protein n=1 Tax=Auriscalpium vulgare TaxID=40419 RepID=A0ACB8R9T0_9AGAM|nr:hypothetical protein FA95DRAFT_1502363 [Auriscalpium vulgare]